MLERLRTAALQVPERRGPRTGDQSWLFTLSPLMHSNAHSGCAALLRVWPGLPLSPSPIFISPLISSFVSISLSLMSWKNNKKRERKREAFIQRLGRHKGSGVPSIGVALTWLNSSSRVSLVMSLIPKTSHAPFTASHTKLNAKSKTQTLGRKSVRKKKARESIPIQGKGCVALQTHCPSVLPAGSPNFWCRKPRKNTVTQKTKNWHLSPKEPVIVVQLLHLQLSCLNSFKTTEEEKATPTPKSNLPDNKPTTAVKTIRKIPINGNKPCMVFRRAGNRKFNPANWWLEERKPTLKAVIRPSTIPPLWAF